MGRLSHTKYILRNTPSRVTITRRHHPLEGQQLDVLKGGKARITIRLANGTSLYIRRDWTDADGGQPRADATHDGFFTVDSLRRLADLIDALAAR